MHVEQVTTHRGRRPARVAVILAALLASFVLAACGDGGDEPAGSAAAQQGTEQSGFPVTIRSKLGSATISKPPQRVVTLDNQSTDAALALGVTPVGIANVSYVPGEAQSWTKAALAGRSPDVIDVETDIPYERVAALRPDLIVAANTFQLDTKGVYDRLRRIAPTVHFLNGSLGDTWQQTTRRVGKALGREDRASRLVAATEAQIRATRKRTPALEGKTIASFNADPAGLYAISDPNDYSIRFLEQLGLKIAPQVDQLKDDFPGRAVISAERYSNVLDADLLLGTAVSAKGLAELGRSKLFKRVDAVRDGRYVSVPIGPATSIAFPSLLSVRYALKEVVPKLARAAQQPDSPAR